MSDDCEIPEFYSDAEPVARKEHACCECSAPIKKGERHFSVSGKWDGVFNKFRQHFLCEQACEFIRDHFTEGECIGFGTLMDQWRDYAHAKPVWIETFEEIRQRRKWVAGERAKEFRAMMAKILRRTRRERRGSVAA